MEKHLVYFVLALCLAAGCAMPKDPGGTLERVRGDTLLVGVTENEPWVTREDGQPGGVEAALVRQLAEELDAEVFWTWGGVAEHMEALSHREIDLAIGGLARSSPWQQEAGLTQPYYTSRERVGYPPASAAPEDIDGAVVAVERGDVLAAYIADRGGTPHRMETPARAEGLVAASDWELKQWGFAASDIVLHRKQHVMALPPGENAWIMHVEQFLQDKEADVAQMLEQQE